MKNLVPLIFLLLTVLNSKTTTVTYTKFSEGKALENDSTVYIYSDGIASVIKVGESKEHYYIDFKSGNTVEMLTANGKKYQLLNPLSDLPVPVSTEKDTLVIAGFKTEKAVYSAFSNKIEVWFTKETEAKGSPSLSYFPEGSLILRLDVNSGIRYQAKTIDTSSKDKISGYPDPEAVSVSAPEYEELVIKSRYITIPVFEKEQINWQDSIVNPEGWQAGFTYRLNRGNILLKKIKLPKITPAGNAFLKVTAWSNGDAYDRLGSVFILTEENEAAALEALRNGAGNLPEHTGMNGATYKGVIRTDGFTPPVELMRFITSFGVGAFNDKVQINNYNWADSVVYVQDVTSLIPQNDEEVWIGILIGNYDKGGHYVSLELDWHPWNEEVPYEKWILPLFNTVNGMDGGGSYNKIFQGDSLTVEFEMPENIEDPYLLFTTTGHGGWGGGDEFNPKLNQIFVDGREIYKVIPWRTDCSTYRMSNPASGNFENGLSSSDFSRSNWCPGTLTPPYLVPLKDIEPGHHVMKIAIDIGKEDGNSWAVSGVLTGNRKLEEKK